MHDLFRVGLLDGGSTALKEIADTFTECGFVTEVSDNVRKLNYQIHFAESVCGRYCFRMKYSVSVGFFDFHAFPINKIHFILIDFYQPNDFQILDKMIIIPESELFF